MTVCVLLHSPLGLFQLRAKNTEKKEKTLKELLCSFERNDPKKGFSWGEKKRKSSYSGLHIQKGTYPITKPSSSISTSINPSSILRPHVSVCAGCTATG